MPFCILKQKIAQKHASETVGKAEGPVDKRLATLPISVLQIAKHHLHTVAYNITYHKDIENLIAAEMIIVICFKKFFFNF